MVKLLHIGHVAFFMKLYHDFFYEPWNILKIYIEFKEVFIVNKWVCNHEVVMFRSGFTLEMNLVLKQVRNETNFE